MLLSVTLLTFPPLETISYRFVLKALFGKSSISPRFSACQGSHNIRQFATTPL